VQKKESIRTQLCLGLLRTEYGIQEEEQDPITVCLHMKGFTAFLEINLLCVMFEGIEV
jgi:hypothetical protein